MENMFTEFLHGSLQQNKMKIINYMTEYFGTLKLNMNSKIHDHLNIDVLKYMRYFEILTIVPYWNGWNRIKSTHI